MIKHFKHLFSRCIDIFFLFNRHQGSGVVGDRAPSSGSTSLKYSQSLKDPTKDPKVRYAQRIKIYYIAAV